MSGHSQFFGSSRHAAPTSPHDRMAQPIQAGVVADPLEKLRKAFEVLPNSRKYAFTHATRAEVLSDLYDTFWGPYAHLFLPNSNSSLPLHATLSEVQLSLGFCGAGKDQIVPGKACGYIFKKGESCFRCKDCALDDSCVLCSRCFHATDHVDHNVSFFIAQQPGGCCDCGDDEAWRLDLKCPLHPPKDPNVPTSPIPPSQPPTQFQPQFQFTPKATQRAAAMENIPPVSDYPFRINVPPELREIMHRTIGYAFDFILDTLDYSPDEPTLPDQEADLRLQASGDPMPKEQYCLVVWNDDKHSYDEIMRILSAELDRKKEDFFTLSHGMDENGREVVEMSTDVQRLMEIAQVLVKIDMSVTIRKSYDTFREQMVGVIIEWLLDLTRCRIGTDTLLLREIMAAELLTPRKRDNLPFPSIMSDNPNPTRLDVLFLYHTKLWRKPRLSLKEIYASVIALSKKHKIAIASQYASVYHWVIDAYLLVDREAETSIKYFALQLFTVPSVAIHVVTQHKLVFRLLSMITAFFTNQIIDRHIAAQPSTGVSLDVDSFPFRSKRFMPVFSDLRYLCHTTHVQDLIISNRDYLAAFVKCCQLFMCINPNKRAASAHVEYETDAWISVFNVTLSLSRVIKVYGEAFNRGSTSQLVAAISTVVHHTLMVCTLGEERLDRSKFSNIMFHNVSFGGNQFSVIKFDVLEGWVSFHHSLHWLLAELFKHVDMLDEEKLRAETGDESLSSLMLKIASPQAMLTLVDYPLRVLAMIAQIRTGLWVRNGFAIRGQLLHYRDYMLRELCYDQDLFILQTNLVILDPGTVFISILDRFGILSYFSGSNNPYTPLGAGFVTEENPHPHLVHPVYDVTQVGLMVEEVLYVIITVLSENANASKMPLAQSIRREVIHALAMGPCSFTDLVKRVSERLVEDVSFEKVLKEVSSFRQPEGIMDTGVYELKEEMYDEVNPFFYHYTKNRREEVEGILMARLKKKKLQEYQQEHPDATDVPKMPDPVIVPKPFGVTLGPFVNLPLAFDSEVLLQIIFYAVYNTLVQTDRSANSPPPSGEAILDQAIHLAMLSVIERPAEFSDMAVRKEFEEGKTVLEAISELEDDQAYKAYQSRALWVIRRIGDAVEGEGELLFRTLRRRWEVVDETAGMDTADNSERKKKTTAEDLEEAKKKAAQARKEAIMKQMREQQNSFKMNFATGDGDLDSSEEDDDEDDETDGRSAGTAGGDAEGEGEDDMDVDSGSSSFASAPPSLRASRRARGSRPNLNASDMDVEEERQKAEGHDDDEEQISYGTCIVCQEDLNSTRPFGMLALVQGSRLVRKQPEGTQTYVNDALSTPLSLDRLPGTPQYGGGQGTATTPTGTNSKPTFQFPPVNADITDAQSYGLTNFEGYPMGCTRFGLYASVCSHMMHKDCFQGYTSSIRQRHRAQATRNHPESIPRKEYICPLCKSLGNVVLPVAPPSALKLNTTPFSDWVRASGISLLKAKPDSQLDSVQVRTGTGEFTFWGVQDGGYASAVRAMEKFVSPTVVETYKMLDTVVSVSRFFSQQTRHLRERLEPEPNDRGAGMYLPDELVGYTITGIEIAQRGLNAGAASAGGGGDASVNANNALLVDNIPEAQYRMVRGLLLCLTRLAAMHFQSRPDEGREAIRQAIVKRLLPEWSRTSLTSFSYPLLLRDPLTILVETAAVAPDMLKHVLVLTYYACLARTVIGLVFVLGKIRSSTVTQIPKRSHEELFGDVRMFFLSVVRHSPVFEHTATVALETFGEARIEKLLYHFTLPFLRRAAILCRAVLPHAFPTPPNPHPNQPPFNEYIRLIQFLRLPPLSELPRIDALQNALSSWSAHWGHSHASQQFNTTVHLDYPGVYRLAKLPLVLDSLFGPRDGSLVCGRCETVPNDAAICLICGTTVCMQSHCCTDFDYGERGECNMHTRECGGTVGLYFLVRRSALLYLNSGNGSFAASPYLDAHGEVDMSMRRGRRQFLHQLRWEEVRKIWMNHGVPSVIARKLESTMDNGGWETL